MPEMNIPSIRRKLAKMKKKHRAEELELKKTIDWLVAKELEYGLNNL